MERFRSKIRHSARSAESEQDRPAGRIVRVLPDEPGLNKTFDYLLSDRLAGAATVRLGSIVRFPLHGRNLRGWITGLDVSPSTDLDKLKLISKVTGFGPPRELLALSRWAATRWWGRPASLLRTASAVRAIPALPAVRPIGIDLIGSQDFGEVGEVTRRALDTAALVPDLPVVVLRIPPTADSFGVVVEAVRFAGERGVLVIAPSNGEAELVARRLRRTGITTALLPDDWARAAVGGCVVVGSRSAAWAPIEGPGVIVVLDEHDEAHQQEQMPTWNARDVAIERGRRSASPVLLVSPIPSVVSCHRYPVFATSRSFERAHWPLVEIIDRSDAEPGRQGLLSARLGQLVREPGIVVCVLNRKGRASMSVCAKCRDVAACERCDGALVIHDEDFECPRCQMHRPVVCASCGGSSFRNVRMGVTRAREELEALAGRPVSEVTADSPAVGDLTDVVVGTESVLHQVPSADMVVFLDLDSELFAARYRASEQALALIVRAARLLHGRNAGSTRKGKLVLQTRVPDHDVVRAAVLGDPSAVLEPERVRREQLRLPPFAALAQISGAGATEFVEQLRQQSGVQVGGVGTFVARCATEELLADSLSACDRPSARIRVEVDPWRL